jgi:hypothetical protein
MIPLLVELLGELQDFLGTELDAVAAAFATFLDDMHDAKRHFYLVCV